MSYIDILNRDFRRSEKQKREENKKLFLQRKKAYAKKRGIRVGDWIREPSGNMTRVTHHWGKEIGQVQTGGNGGSYYLGKGYASYSGSLDEGYHTSQLRATKKRKVGSVWLFHHDYATAGGGVDFKMPFRVYEVKKTGARRKK